MHQVDKKRDNQFRTKVKDMKMSADDNCLLEFTLSAYIVQVCCHIPRKKIAGKLVNAGRCSHAASVGSNQAVLLANFIAMNVQIKATSDRTGT